jgi:AhpD family alkylhydroperoxidase
MYDMKKLEKLKKLGTLAPQAMQAFHALSTAATADGAIPRKYKELMAIAVALTTQCPYCIEIHTRQAREAGVTDTELAEAVMVSAALRAGAAVVHGAHCLE